jgi:anti-sigma B factor antagonist
MEFKLATADLGDGVFSVSVAGEVVHATAPQRKEALGDVLVDLSKASFIDSTTLGVLMGAVKRLRPSGGELVIACHDPNIRKIFEITLLDRVFKIYDTPGPAVEYLRDSRTPAASDVSSRG